jgi:hypothetical protein
MRTINTKTLVYSLSALLLMLFSNLICAASGNFQIEILIFSQNYPNSEVFDQVSSKIEWPSNLTELAAYPNADHKMLEESLAALSKNSANQPILHSAWLQSVDENTQGSPVHIQSADGKINGFVQLLRGRNLQIIADVEFSPGPSDESAESLTYRINEKRQFQLNDLNYLDHPKFGIITKITTINPF